MIMHILNNIKYLFCFITLVTVYMLYTIITYLAIRSTFFFIKCCTCHIFVTVLGFYCSLVSLILWLYHWYCDCTIQRIFLLVFETSTSGDPGWNTRTGPDVVIVTLTQCLFEKVLVELFFCLMFDLYITLGQTPQLSGPLRTVTIAIGLCTVSMTWPHNCKRKNEVQVFILELLYIAYFSCG